MADDRDDSPPGLPFPLSGMDIPQELIDGIELPSGLELPPGMNEEMVKRALAERMLMERFGAAPGGGAPELEPATEEGGTLTRRIPPPALDALKEEKEGFGSHKGESATQKTYAPASKLRVEDAYRDVLQEVWQTAADAVGASDQVRLPLRDNPYLQHVQERYGPEYFFISDYEINLDQAGAEGITGSMSEIGLQIVLRVRELQGDREGLRAFYRGTLAATLERLVRDGAGTPESQVDMVLIPLSQIQVRPQRCSESIRDFVAGLRRHLGTQEEEERGSGYYVTWGGLADLLMPARGRECWAQGVFYYHEILSHFCQVVAAGGSLARDECERVRIASNNSANTVEDLRRLAGKGEYDEVLLGVRNSMKRISAAMAGQALELAEEEVVLALSLIAHLLGNVPADQVHPIWARFLDDMMASATAWLPGRDHLQLAMVELGAGMVRIAVEERRSDAPSTFFNAGISIDRHRTAGTGNLKREDTEWARAVLNGLGVWWAVEAGDAQLMESMLRSDGLSCTVNFLSAASNMEWDDDGRAKVEAVAAAVFGMRSVLGFGQTDFFQMGNSLKDLKIRLPENLPVSDPRELQRRIGTVLGHLAVMPAEGGGLVPADWPGEPGALRASAEMSRQVMQRLVAKPEDYASMLVQPLVELMGEIEAGAENPGQALLKLYGPLAGADPDSPGPGPLVQAGLMSIEEWRQAARRAVPVLPRSPADVLRTSGVLDWMLQT